MRICSKRFVNKDTDKHYPFRNFYFESYLIDIITKVFRREDLRGVVFGMAFLKGFLFELRPLQIHTRSSQMAVNAKEVMPSEIHRRRMATEAARDLKSARVHYANESDSRLS
ncbi:hypothetical protein EVAR_59228_1 [Eumeta japonica]|uniref:Uncharacterized protein n=1 Tax=Eumeta variegata TaxID=151549 RepID=A0A4C1ZH99_EUMVA|nr:hypothetical protein EVAR_59228_1 [Eumeta japonica]